MFNYQGSEDSCKLSVSLEIPVLWKAKHHHSNQTTKNRLWARAPLFCQSHLYYKNRLGHEYGKKNQSKQTPLLKYHVVLLDIKASNHMLANVMKTNAQGLVMLN